VFIEKPRRRRPRWSPRLRKPTCGEHYDTMQVAPQALAKSKVISIQHMFRVCDGAVGMLCLKTCKSPRYTSLSLPLSRRCSDSKSKEEIRHVGEPRGCPRCVMCPSRGGVKHQNVNTSEILCFAPLVRSAKYRAALYVYSPLPKCSGESKNEKPKSACVAPKGDAV
jgi:hypothetical protein